MPKATKPIPGIWDNDFKGPYIFEPAEVQIDNNCSVWYRCTVCNHFGQDRQWRRFWNYFCCRTREEVLAIEVHRTTPSFSIIEEPGKKPTEINVSIDTQDEDMMKIFGAVCTKDQYVLAHDKDRDYLDKYSKRIWRRNVKIGQYKSLPFYNQRGYLLRCLASFRDLVPAFAVFVDRFLQNDGFIVGFQCEGFSKILQKLNNSYIVDFKTPWSFDYLSSSKLIEEKVENILRFDYHRTLLRNVLETENGYMKYRVINSLVYLRQRVKAVCADAVSKCSPSMSRCGHLFKRPVKVSVVADCFFQNVKQGIFPKMFEEILSALTVTWAALETLHGDQSYVTYQLSISPLQYDEPPRHFLEECDAFTNDLWRFRGLVPQELDSAFMEFTHAMWGRCYTKGKAMSLEEWYQHLQPKEEESSFVENVIVRLAQKFGIHQTLIEQHFAKKFPALRTPAIEAEVLDLRQMVPSKDWSKSDDDPPLPLLLFILTLGLIFTYYVLTTLIAPSTGHLLQIYNDHVRSFIHGSHETLVATVDAAFSFEVLQPLIESPYFQINIAPPKISTIMKNTNVGAFDALNEARELLSQVTLPSSIVIDYQNELDVLFKVFQSSSYFTALQIKTSGLDYQPLLVSMSSELPSPSLPPLSNSTNSPVDILPLTPEPARKPTPFACDLCPSRFGSQGNLRRHVRMFHSAPLETYICKRPVLDGHGKVVRICNTPLTLGVGREDIGRKHEEVVHRGQGLSERFRRRNRRKGSRG